MEQPLKKKKKNLFLFALHLSQKFQSCVPNVFIGEAPNNHSPLLSSSFLQIHLLFSITPLQHSLSLAESPSPQHGCTNKARFNPIT